MQQFLIAAELLFPILRQSGEVESDDYAYPTELLNALAEWHAEFSAAISAESYHRCVKLLNVVLQKHEITDVFQQQLAQIQSVASSALSKEAKTDDAP